MKNRKKKQNKQYISLKVTVDRLYKKVIDDIKKEGFNVADHVHPNDANDEIFNFAWDIFESKSCPLPEDESPYLIDTDIPQDKLYQLTLRLIEENPRSKANLHIHSEEENKEELKSEVMD